MVNPTWTFLLVYNLENKFKKNQLNTLKRCFSLKVQLRRPYHIEKIVLGRVLSNAFFLKNYLVCFLNWRFDFISLSIKFFLFDFGWVFWPGLGLFILTLCKYLSETNKQFPKWRVLKSKRESKKPTKLEILGVFIH